MKQAIKGLSYALFPKRCALCGDVIVPDKHLCEACESLKLIEGAICNKCGREKTHCSCQRENFSPNYKSFCAPYYYDASPRKSVHRLKFEGFSELVPEMSRRIVTALQMRFEGVEFDLVTYVPMSRLRRYKRGYNQSALLAQETARLLGLKSDGVLMKTRRTRSQRKSNAKQRRVNLYGAFDVLPNKSVEGKTILLVDDVKTTGTTLSELAFSLREAGAKAVYATAFCVTDKKEKSS